MIVRKADTVGRRLMEREDFIDQRHTNKSNVVIDKFIWKSNLKRS